MAVTDSNIFTHPSGGHGPSAFSINNAIAGVVMVVIVAIGVGITVLVESPVPAIVAAVIGVLLGVSIKVANEWEKAVVLRMGRFSKLAGPGIFLIAPILDSISQMIDMRITTSPFRAETTLTKDSVPVDVDAVLFWQVWDAKKGILEVADYQNAISWASQTALKDVIGRTNLSDLLIGREKIDEELQTIIDERTTQWGVAARSVEIRDVIIPSGLQDAMSRQAQAERERQARVILGDAERQIADSFMEAAAKYNKDPIALHLRAMNMLYEGLKEKSSLIVVPSTAVETMGLGVIGGMAGLREIANRGEIGEGKTE